MRFAGPRLDRATSTQLLTKLGPNDDWASQRYNRDVVIERMLGDREIQFHKDTQIVRGVRSTDSTSRAEILRPAEELTVL